MIPPVFSRSIDTYDAKAVKSGVKSRFFAYRFISFTLRAIKKVSPLRKRKSAERTFDAHSALAL